MRPPLASPRVLLNELAVLWIRHELLNALLNCLVRLVSTLNFFFNNNLILPRLHNLQLRSLLRLLLAAALVLIFFAGVVVTQVGVVLLLLLNLVHVHVHFVYFFLLDLKLF